MWFWSLLDLYLSYSNWLSWHFSMSAMFCFRTWLKFQYYILLITYLYILNLRTSYRIENTLLKLCWLLFYIGEVFSLCPVGLFLTFFSSTQILFFFFFKLFGILCSFLCPSPCWDISVPKLEALSSGSANWEGQACKPVFVFFTFLPL